MTLINSLFLYLAIVVLSGLSLNGFAAVSSSLMPSANNHKYLSADIRLGIPQTYILETIEDEFGFLWFASSEGLIRFDGYETKIYLSDKHNKATLPSNFVRRVFIDTKGTLWVATIKGLARFNRYTEKFDRIFISDNASLDTDIWEINETQDGKILVASSNDFYQYEESINKLVKYNKNIRFPSNIVTFLDEPNRILFGTLRDGGFVYDKTSRQLYALTETNPFSIHLDSKEIRDIQHLDNNYWFATEKGLVLLDTETGNNEHKYYVKDCVIRSVTQHKKTIIVTSGSEIVELLKNQTDSTYYVSSQFDSSNDNILSLYIDTNNSRWLGTDNGVKLKTNFTNYLPIITAKFRNENSDSELLPNDIWGIGEDTSGNIWSVSQNGEVQKYTPSNEQVTLFHIEENIEAWDLAIDRSNSLWIASNKGLLVFSIENNNLVPISTLLQHNPVYDIYMDDEKVWYFTDDSTLSYIETSDPSLTQVDIKFDTTLPQSRVAKLDSQNRFWFASPFKTIIYDNDKRQIIDAPDYLDTIKALIAVIEAKDFIWLITHDQGILKVNSDTLEVTDTFLLPNQNETIFSALGSDEGIWFTNGSSLYSFDFDTHLINQTIKPAQLSYNILYERVALKASDELFLFGGKYGYHLLNPSLLKASQKTSLTTNSPIISGFRLRSENLPFSDPSSSLSKPIYLSNELNLDYNDDRFSFLFALVNSPSPLEVQYRYRLKGYDDKWVYTEDALSRRAIFHNISWGKYSLLIQAKEPDKAWSSSTQLAINIAPPPWFSAEAIFVYVFTFIVLIGLFIRYAQQKSKAAKIVLASEERLKLTLWSSGDELWDWDITKNHVHRSNIWGTISFPIDSIRGNKNANGNIHPLDLDKVKLALQQHLDGLSDFYEISYRVKTIADEWIWVLDRGKVVSKDDTNTPIRMTGTLKNIQHLKEAEKTLELFERSFENISEGVFITNTAFKFISVNSAYCKFTGETQTQALSSYLSFNQYPDVFTEEVKKTLKHRQNWSGEVESQRRNGESYEIEMNINAIEGDDGKISHYVGVFSDITARKGTEKELLKLSNTDPLTELPNRSFFQAYQQNLVRRNENHTLLILDMDNFKKINDSLGHHTGDLLIKQISTRLRSITRNADTCYRIGGDEFSILIEQETNVHLVTRYAQNVLNSLSAPFVINKQEFVLSASLGIALYPVDGASPQELLKNADTAMYIAKNTGGNAYKFFSGEMNKNAVRQLQIENLIRHGLKGDLFTVFYQPKVDIISGRMTGMEALVRFEHPEKGIISPSQFIPLAEQSGQIIDIGEVVLEKALQDTKRWVDAGLFSGRVAVNLSAKQFELTDLDERITKIINKVGISPAHLECEITEGTLMENPEQGLELMHRLREKSIHLALDDFGTGYSSLAYLKRFPLNTLKIDKAFIDDIAHSNVDRHMAAAIINIAHNLNLNVVAEGVEREEQLAILKRYDCEMLQGYLFSKPVRAERFEAMLRDNMSLHRLLSR
nr:EAL domain-containing protein [Alteromonas sp. 5E99-2]